MTDIARSTVRHGYQDAGKRGRQDARGRRVLEFRQGRRL